MNSRRQKIDIRKYMNHLRNCNIMQDWSEAEEALSLCPEGPDKDQAYNDMQEKRKECTCGFKEAVEEVYTLQSRHSTDQENCPECGMPDGGHKRGCSERN